MVKPTLNDVSGFIAITCCYRSQSPSSQHVQQTSGGGNHSKEQGSPIESAGIAPSEMKAVRAGICDSIDKLSRSQRDGKGTRICQEVHARIDM